jgi:alpha-glucosidase
LEEESNTISTEAQRGDCSPGPSPKGIAIFYPPGINKAALPPSLAVINEPDYIEPPASWKVFPQFYSQGIHNVVSIEVEEGTSIYGTGQVTGPLLRNGRNTVLWNIGNFCYELFEGRNLYQSHPWVLGVRRNGFAFGVIFDTTWLSEIDLGQRIRFTTDGPPCRVIVIDRDSPQAVMRGLAELTGNMPLPPKWSLGFHQSRWSYYPDSRMKEVADEYRHRKLPCDVIWADIHYMDGFRVFTFDPVGFPDPKATNDYLHERGFKAVWTSDPGIRAEPGYPVYDRGTERDFWVKTANGEEYHGEVWPGPCAFPDFTRPEVRGWWAGLVADFVSSGIDGVWIDMNEPDVVLFTTMPADNWHLGGGGLPKGSHLQYHNVYGMLVTRAIREGLVKARPDKRPFVLTRSSFLGGQRYAAMWTGDNASSWQHLRMSVPMALNLGLSGQPFNGADIGGFWGNATPELFAHWISVGVLFPFARAHTAEGTDAHEPWAFGSEVEAVSRVALERRYRLLPYLYTLFREASTNGMPVMRPLFFADPSDPDLRSEDQSFLLGADLLVVPKWAENPRLPKGIWRSVSLVGEDSINDPYQPNVLMRGGSIIPLGRVIQHTGQESLEPLTLLVCLDEGGRAEGRLYEDVGDGYDFQQGEFLLTTYFANKKGDSVVVTIAHEEGGMKRPERETKIQIVGDSYATGGGSAKRDVE